MADRERLYRILANPKVTVDKLLAGHFERNLERMHEAFGDPGRS